MIPPWKTIWIFHINLYISCLATSTTSESHHKRKTLVAPDINISLDQSEGSLHSDDFLDAPDDLDINIDDIETPDETDSLEYLANGNDLEWEGKSWTIHYDILHAIVLSFPNIFSNSGK